MINKKYLPSKNFLIALSITVVIIVIVIIFNSLQNNNHAVYKNQGFAEGTSTTVTKINIDSDNDGLPDWKETLYGTDPHNPDTDRDGTNDGDEVTQGRDPLKANTAPKGQEPNDKIDPKIIEQNKKIIGSYESLSDTDKFSRGLISDIVAAAPQNGALDENKTNSIITNALQRIPLKNYVGTTTINDLNLQKTDSTNLIKNMGDYSKNYFRETEKFRLIFGKDIALIISYMSPNSTSTDKDVLTIINQYQTIVNNLIKMPVPVAIGYYDISYHLAIINDLEKIISMDKDMVGMKKGSVLSIFPSLSIYNTVTKDLSDNLSIVDSILKIQR